MSIGKSHIGKVLNIALFLIVIATAGYALLHTHNNSLKGLMRIAEKIPATPDDENMTLRDSIVEYSKQFLGTPYVVAAAGKGGFDCSGFVNYVYKHFDIEVPRSSALFGNFGTEINITEVRKGDILIFLSPTRNEIGHVGIVTAADGAKSEFIHASSGKEKSVILTKLDKPGYTKRFVKAIRVL